MAGAFGYWGLTGRIQSLEAVLFGGQPSLYLSQQWNWVPLSEYLHFCYFFYMIMVPVVGGYWYASRQRVAFRELILLLSVTFYSSYLFFYSFPSGQPVLSGRPFRESAVGSLFLQSRPMRFLPAGVPEGAPFPALTCRVRWCCGWWPGNGRGAWPIC